MYRSLAKLLLLLFIPCIGFSQASRKYVVDTTATTSWIARGKDAAFTQKIVWLNVVVYGTSTSDTLWLSYNNDTTSTKNAIDTGYLIPIIPGETGVFADDVYINKFWIKYTGSTAPHYVAVFH
jgi:hypothetical protein